MVPFTEPWLTSGLPGTLCRPYLSSSACVRGSANPWKDPLTVTATVQVPFPLSVATNRSIRLSCAQTGPPGLSVPVGTLVVSRWSNECVTAVTLAGPVPAIAGAATAADPASAATVAAPVIKILFKWDPFLYHPGAVSPPGEL